MKVDYNERLNELGKRFNDEFHKNLDENSGLYLFQETMRNFEALQEEFYKLYSEEAANVQIELENGTHDPDEHVKFINGWASRYANYRTRMVAIDKIYREKTEKWESNNARIKELNEAIESNNELIEAKKSRIERLEKLIQFKSNTKYHKHSETELEMDREEIEFLKSQIDRLEMTNAKYKERLFTSTWTLSSPMWSCATIQSFVASR